MPTVCLAMIVRNEAHVIERCLASVRPVVDAWVVVDTGSTDGTPDNVRACLSGLPGEVVQRPWVDFAQNRTQAFEYASGRADYVLVIDADEVLEIDPGFDRSTLTHDAYLLESRYGGHVYVRAHILRSRLPWRYVGVVHEYPECQDAAPAMPLPGLRVTVFHDGARSRDPRTARRDALVLEAALLDQPDNPRNVFYLAQSYRDAGDLELAVRHYRARLSLGGWADEVWYSLYQIARCREFMGHPRGAVLDDYLAAYELQPYRAEPLYWAAMRYARDGADDTAQLLLDRAVGISRPGSERLFVEADVYEYLLPLQYAEVCARSGRRAEAIACCNRLLRDPALPAERIEEALACRRRALDGQAPARHDGETDPRIRLCVTLETATAALDDCLESIERLTVSPHDVWVIDDGSGTGVEDRLSAGAADVHLVRNERAIGVAACVERFAREQCDPSDVVVPLASTSRFAAPDVLRHVRTAFADPACAVMYGQYRRGDGTLGDAEPAADEDDFARRAATLASRSPVIFRAGGLSEADSGWDALLRAAGPHRTRFTDAVLTVHDDAVPAPSLRPAAVTADAALSVSCLMVTHDRLALAKRAIRCFANQTYPDRELVIVTDGEERFRRSLERYVSEIGAEYVRLVQVDDPGLSLGALRNVSLEAASGDVVCQWDDDDCCHPDRISVQLERMRAETGRACFLTDHFQFLEGDRALVWVDWTLGGKSGRDQLLPGTLMMYRDSRFRYAETGPYAERGEDSMLLASLFDQVPVAALRGEGHLYLYTYHGRNTFDRAHHHRLAMFSRSVGELVPKRELIRIAMAEYAVPRPFMVVGRDGPAFMLNV